MVQTSLSFIGGGCWWKLEAKSWYDASQILRFYNWPMKCVRVLLWFVGDRMGLKRIQCNLRNQTVQLVFVCFCSTVASGVQSSWTALNWQRVTQQRKKTKFDRIEAKIMSRTSFYYDCFDLHSQTPLICFIIRNFYLFHYIPRKISKISFYYFDFLFYLFSIYLFFFWLFFLSMNQRPQSMEVIFLLWNLRGKIIKM